MYLIENNYVGEEGRERKGRLYAVLIHWALSHSIIGAVVYLSFCFSPLQQFFGTLSKK
jgi:hypothetical protein